MEKSPKPPAKKPVSGKQRPSHVVVYYNNLAREFLYRLNGRYLALKTSELRMHFRKLGLLDDGGWFDGQREIDWPLWNAQENHLVDYAGPLAGHRTGIFTDGSKRSYLITDQANGVFDDMPKKSPEPEFFKAFVQELLPEDQWLHFCFWLAIALKSLRKSDWRPGQVVVFAGPAQCGKSLLQYIITEVLGGRVANPWNYMNGDKFNADLAKAEHWMIEDPDSTTDMRTRISFGNKLKECANNEQFNIHGKNKDAISLRIFRRISLSINDEPEFLAVIPPMDKSVRDKISLYKCSPAVECLKRFIDENPPLPGFDGGEGEFDRSMVKKVVAEETPLIRAWLLRAFRVVPKELRDNRSSLIAYHHPELLEELTQMSMEARLLSLIDQVCFISKDGPWTGKAIELEKELRTSSFAFEVEKVLRHFGQCGSYLGKLSKSRPDRVTKKVRDGYNSWTISSPSEPTKKETQHEHSSTNGEQKQTSPNNPVRSF